MNHIQVWAQEVLAPQPQWIRVLMVGDVMGRPGRRVLKDALESFRASVYPDLVSINAENIAGGFGITSKIHDEMVEAGVDVMTMGNHWHDKPDVHALRLRSKALVLPQNLKGVEGVARVPEVPIRRFSRTVRIVNLMGLFAMKQEYESPYLFLSSVYNDLESSVRNGRSIVLLDCHAEAGSEKQAMVWKLDGICAGMIGTHTHVPTADERITDLGTAFVTDVGMTGPYQSIIGMDRQRTLMKYFEPSKAQKAHEVSKEPAWFCAFLVEVSPETGLAVRAHRLQLRTDEDRFQVSTVERRTALSSLTNV